MNIKSHSVRITGLWAAMLWFSFSTFAQTQNFIQLPSNNFPYNVVMNIYGDPATQMAFNWFTNAGITGGKVKIMLGGSVVDSVNATCTSYSGYIENKAVVSGLLPNTTYSFQVGGVKNSWSNTGTFTTAKDNKDPFSFIYITDSQGSFTALKNNTDMVLNKHPNAGFWLHCGDLTSFGNNQTYWNLFFTSFQNLFFSKPFVPVTGNHDTQQTYNFKHHFNLNSTSFDAVGSTYTFLYGDAQFFAINSEHWDYSPPSAETIDSIKNWMRAKVATNQNVTWRIVYFHQPVFTGAKLEQNEYCIPAWHNALTLLFDELNIDLALQGHSHIYDVIGPVKSVDVVPSAVSNVMQGPIIKTINESGKSGGTFNVKNGTLYFTNGTFGDSTFFAPFPLIDMPGKCFKKITNYPSLMTGRYGQIGKPVYSHISVSSGSIVISTYKIDKGSSQLMDEITLVKYCASVPDDPGSQTITTSQTWNTNKTITQNIVVPEGVTLTITATAYFSTYKITVKCGGKLIVSGGTIDDGKVVVQYGGKLILSNTGKILLGNYDNLEVELGAEFDKSFGEILLK